MTRKAMGRLHEEPCRAWARLPNATKVIVNVFVGTKFNKRRGSEWTCRGYQFALERRKHGR
jgi:hypothetical protein